MNTKNIITKTERLQAQAQWTLEQSKKHPISAILTSQYRSLLSAIGANLSKDKREKLLSILSKNEIPLVKYTEDPKGRKAWCILIAEKKGFAEDYIHYNEDSYDYSWSSNEGQPHKRLNELLEGLDRDLQIAIYEAYTINNLLNWGMIQDMKTF